VKCAKPFVCTIVRSPLIAKYLLRDKPNRSIANTNVKFLHLKEITGG
jgi:hypothetical protein